MASQTVAASSQPESADVPDGGAAPPERDLRGRLRALWDGSRWFRFAVVSGLFAGLILVAVRPVPSEISTSVPGNLGDPILIIWILRWGFHALVSQPLALFDANIFAPYSDTLLHSETLLALMPIYTAFWFITGKNAVLALNLTSYTLIFVNLWATYALTRHFTRRRDAAIVAAVTYALAGSLVLARIGALHVQTLVFVPLAFLLLFKLLERPRWTIAILLGVTNAAAVLSSTYISIGVGVALSVAVLVYFAAKRFRIGREVWTWLVTSVVVTLVITAPVTIGYASVQDRAPDRSTFEAGVNPADFLQPGPGNQVYGFLKPIGGVTGEHRFFIGFVPMALAAVGLYVAVRATRRSRRHEPESAETDLTEAELADGDRTLHLWMLVAGTVAVGVIALGPRVLGIPMPFEILSDGVPGFGGIRAPERLTLVSMLTAAVFAGLGFAWLRSRVRLRGVGVAFAVVVIAAIMIENWYTIRYAPLDQSSETLAVYDELADRPRGSVVELPIADPAPVWPDVEAPRMVYSATDWHPRLNGYSGFVPPTYGSDAQTLHGFPSAESLQLLVERDIRYVVVHVGDPNGVDTEPGYATFDEIAAAAIVAALPEGVTVQRYGSSYLIDLDPNRVDE